MKYKSKQPSIIFPKVRYIPFVELTVPLNETTLKLKKMLKEVYFASLIFCVWVSCTYAGLFHHGYGYGKHDWPLNVGFHGSTLHNFYPGDWGNFQNAGNMGSYQYFQYNPMLNTYPQGAQNWNQVLGGSNLNNWNGVNNMNGWNSGMWNGDLGFNNNWNNVGWNNPGFNSNWNSIGWGNPGFNSNWNSIGWGNPGFNTNWNSIGWGNPGWNNNWNNLGWNNNWNNFGWNNNVNGAWNIPSPLQLQSH